MRANCTFHTFEFERQFDEKGANEWFQNNSYLPFVLSAVYAMAVFVGQKFMKNRDKLDLRTPLTLWSLSLALFSIVGGLRMGWYLLNVLSFHGFRQAVCDTEFYSEPISKFWACTFALSKAPELGDTLFIILRKQRLIFLHWYHHITVLLYCWFSYRDRVAGGIFFMSMNFIVHALMYSYYTARAARLQVPKPLAPLITISQIMQMCVGLSVLVLVFKWRDEEQCKSTSQNIFWGSLMYFSYLLLFCSFFYSSYISKPRPKRD